MVSPFRSEEPVLQEQLRRAEEAVATLTAELGELERARSLQRRPIHGRALLVMGAMVFACGVGWLTGRAAIDTTTRETIETQRMGREARSLVAMTTTDTCNAQSVMAREELDRCQGGLDARIADGPILDVEGVEPALVRPAIFRAAWDVTRCAHHGGWDGLRTSLSAAMTFAADGTVESVTASNALGLETQRCAERVLRAVHVPPFRGERATVDATFRLP